MVSGSAFSIETLSEGIWGFLLPLLTLWNCKELLSASEPWLQLCLVSPWFMACYHCIATQLLAVWPGLRLYATGRATALPSANTCFNERVQLQRAYRTQRYDVYLPPPTSEPLVDAKGNRVQQALLFFPGALVPHLAYSEVLSQLSDAGFVVVVASVEPLRLAYHRLGTDQGSIRRIMNQIATNITRRSSRGDKQSPGVVKFTLMGHSMGSFAAMRLFDEFHNTTNETTAKTSFCISHKLILWGVAAFVPFATNLTHHNNAELLIVQGSNDHIRDMMQSGNAALQSLFPSQTTVQTIDGGTHDGFGSYTFPNTNKSSTNEDMDRTLQQKDACRLTTNFLRS
ncbi:alpha/beta fold family hydrolase [Nitzschia inconspicua]|uniref:Alpha/beta fold family hydrolase n=1 Tax=Nitzschia inconspicua TaxID=303405 RepID=A0A9K3LN25_9STRA|nr:alpha/beta fold family hydrolase [Nitzschia inconspicua]